ncbi:DUF3846 domain-containing protein [Mycobacterium sp. AZCC_0083]|uniref:DUF3846 domain-containing protein n=1 Tax=Mycobacterium sp. AZCC_0083 TaxID=2735882 RepID=UPI0016072DA5|nr:DUF3846 domain-containing protein [Mycobacterium sp. AZCC_0083]MBB5167228.1 hypothetical protein [Mycobacterium sp. AZCC_0083]
MHIVEPREKMTKVRYDLTVAAREIQVLVIHPDATYEVRQISQKLQTFQEILGGYMEPVAVEGATFFCNEEGRIHDLPDNPMATYLWWKLSPEMEGLDRFCGTVIVTGPADDAGDSHPILDSVLDLYRRMEAVRLERDA